MVNELNDDNFEKVITGNKPVIVDFWAGWCGPCMMVKPEFEALSKERDDIEFGKVDVDVQRNIASRFNVMSIPTFVVFKGGKEIGRFSGAMPKSSISKQIDSFI
jgi:thioredoxin 1